MTKQPNWLCIANLGDASPIDYGGYFVYIDLNGIYPPEAELLDSPDDDNGTWTVYRFILEPCTFSNGILSDNRYHPDDAAWFNGKLGQIANQIGVDVIELVHKFISNDVCERAFAWREVGEYCGFDNLDSYPLTFKGKKGRKEVEKRYLKDLRQLKKNSVN